MRDQATIGLVINTYNAPEKLDAVLRWLAYGTERPDEILVADDGSTKETREMVTSWQCRMPQWRLRHVWQQDDGYRRSRILNLAIAQSGVDYLVFIDGDCLPFRRFITDHLELAERGTFVQGRRCFVPKSEVNSVMSGEATLLNLALHAQLGGVFKAIRWPRPVIKRNQEMHGILGCNLGIWREDLIAVNGYDESYEGWGAEDSDLAARLYHLGLHRKFVYGRAQLAHLNHPELSRDRYGANQDKLATAILDKKVQCDIGLDQHLSGEK